MLNNIKRNITIFFAFPVVFFLLCFFSNCYFISKNDNKKITKVYLSYDLPIVYLDGRLEKNNNDSLIIYYYDDYILYQLPMHYSLENEKKILLQEIRYNYFAYKKNTKYGFMFDSLNSNHGNKLFIDSILNSRALGGDLNFSSVPKMDSLVSTFNDSASKNIIKIYSSKLPSNDMYDDTAYLYFTDKFKHVPLTFSKELDSIMNMKLYRVRLIYNEKYSAKHKIKMPKREWKFEMGEIPVDNANVIKTFFEQFEKKYIPQL